MAYEFLSKEWIQAYKDALNGELGKAWQEAAKTWEGDFLFIIEADEVMKEKRVIHFDLWHGECRAAKLIEDTENPPKTEYQYIGPYSNWVKLVNGEIDPIKGILMRKFKLVGNKAKVMRAVKAAQELVATAQKIETKFP